ncbi:hypothetical protein VZO05_04280 [Aggregatilineales bacterium SYSU G02658]
MSKFSQGWWWRIFAADFSFSKRQLGQLLLVSGLLLGAAILAIDLIDIGREGGIGPAQRAALIVCGVVALLGLTLIPLGDDPA